MNGWCLKINQHHIEIHPYLKQDFGFTVGLGIPHTLKEWSIQPGQPLQIGEGMLLLSDGLSDDLEEENLIHFNQHLITNISTHATPIQQLQHELNEWGGDDDKTILAIWRTK